MLRPTLLVVLISCLGTGCDRCACYSYHSQTPLSSQSPQSAAPSETPAPATPPLAAEESEPPPKAIDARQLKKIARRLLRESASLVAAGEAMEDARRNDKGRCYWLMNNYKARGERLENECLEELPVIDFSELRGACVFAKMCAFCDDGAVEACKTARDHLVRARRTLR